jgi:hypothetical protein
MQHQSTVGWQNCEASSIKNEFFYERRGSIRQIDDERRSHFVHGCHASIPIKSGHQHPSRLINCDPSIDSGRRKIAAGAP